MINKINFCADLVLEHFNPAGPINQLSQNIKDDNRPYIKGVISQGFEIDYSGVVRVDLKGLVSSTNKINKRESFSFECFEPSCFEATLVETEVNISNICKQTVEITKETKLETRTRVLQKEVREEGVVVQPEITEEFEVPITTETLKVLRNPEALTEVRKYPAVEPYVLNIPSTEIKIRPFTFSSDNKLNVCDLFPNEKPIYYARGAQDIEDNLYFADYGYIDPTTKDFILVDKNIPFSSSQLENTFTSKSIEPIPKGIKYVKIHKLEQGKLNFIGIVYGQLTDNFYFPQQKLVYKKDLFNQSITLEDLSLNLLLFMEVNYSDNLNNSKTLLYRNQNFSNSEIESTIVNSFETLSNLLNSDNQTSLYNSIPNKFNSYSKTDSEYNSLADSDYLELPQDCFSTDCFDADCFKAFDKSKILINRSVKNKSIAWAIIAFSSYIVNYNKVVYKNTVKSLISYLLSQKDSSTGLFYLGWIDSNSKASYSDSLILDSNIDTSTNLTIFLALLKVFEVTQDFSYLLEASFLKSKISNYLFNSNHTFKHSLNNEKESIESSTYGLMYLYIIKDYKKLKPSVQFLNNNLFLVEPINLVNKVFNDLDQVKDKDNFVLDNILKGNESEFNQLFKKTPNDTYDSDTETLKINYLAYSSIKLINDLIDTSLLNTLNKYSLKVEERIQYKRRDATLLFATSCLIFNKSFLEFSSNKFESLIDLNNLEFSKEYIFNKLIKNIPVDYSWIKKDVLNKESNIGQLLYSVAIEQSINKSKKGFISRMSSLEYLYGDMLNQKAADVGVAREVKESDESLRLKIIRKINYIGNTKNQIEEQVSFYDTKISIKDNYKMVQAFVSNEAVNFSYNWGEGFLSGTEKANNLIYTINVYQPLEEDVSNFLKTLLPAGIKANINEVFNFNIGDSSVGFKLAEEDAGCPNIKLENNSNLALEGLGRICLEDEDSIIEQPIVEL